MNRRSLLRGFLAAPVALRLAKWERPNVALIERVTPWIEVRTTGSVRYIYRAFAMRIDIAILASQEVA
jgi:ribosomal protein L39E